MTGPWRRTTTWCWTRGAWATTPPSPRSLPPSQAARPANLAFVTHALGSRTSGVDGSSEGGRINTVNVPGALVLYGVALFQALQRQNPKSKLSVAPVQRDGVWCVH